MRDEGQHCVMYATHSRGLSVFQPESSVWFARIYCQRRLFLFRNDNVSFGRNCGRRWNHCAPKTPMITFGRWGRCPSAANRRKPKAKTAQRARTLAGAGLGRVMATKRIKWISWWLGRVVWGPRIQLKNRMQDASSMKTWQESKSLQPGQLGRMHPVWSLGG